MFNKTEHLPGHEYEENDSNRILGLILLAHRLRVDRFAAIFLVLQFFFCLTSTVLISRIMEMGTRGLGQTLAVAGVTGTVVAIALYFLAQFPGAKINRYLAAVAQLILVASLIHIPESKLDLFGYYLVSVAAIAFYLDWKAIVLAGIVAASDRFFVGVFLENASGSAHFKWIEEVVWITLMVTGFCASVTALNNFFRKTIRDRKILKNRVERSKATVTLNGSGIAIFDLDSEELFEINPQFSRMFGIEDSAHFGSALLTDFIKLAKRDLLQLRIDRPKADDPLILEVLCRHSDGNEFPCRCRLSNIEYEGIPAIVVSVTNVTTEKRNAAETKRLALIAQNTHNLVIICDKNGSIEWVNDAFVARTGMGKEEARGMKPDRLVFGEYVTPVEMRSTMRTLKAGDVYQNETHNRDKSGQSFWLSLTISALLDYDGYPFGYFAVATDITAQKRLESDLRKTRDELEKRVDRRTSQLIASNEKLERETINRTRAEAELREAHNDSYRIMNQIPIPVFVLDADGYYVFANKSFARFQKTDLTSIKGRHFADYLPPDYDISEIEECNRQILSTHETRVIPEVEISLRNGSTYWVKMVKAPLLRQDGTAEYIIGTYVDLTEKKEIEKRLSTELNLGEFDQLAEIINNQPASNPNLQKDQSH